MTARYKLKKILSVMEVEEKMEMGLCFLCDEPLTLDHFQLKHTNVKIVMRDIDEDEVQAEGEDLQQQCAFSANDTEIPLPENHQEKVHDVAEVSQQQSSVPTPILTDSLMSSDSAHLVGDDSMEKLKVEGILPINLHLASTFTTQVSTKTPYPIGSTPFLLNQMADLRDELQSNSQSLGDKSE
jgi:hypothetical protein